MGKREIYRLQRPTRHSASRRSNRSDAEKGGQNRQPLIEGGVHERHPRRRGSKSTSPTICTYAKSGDGAPVEREALSTNGTIARRGMTIDVLAPRTETKTLNASELARGGRERKSSCKKCARSALGRGGWACPAQQMGTRPLGPGKQN